MLLPLVCPPHCLLPTKPETSPSPSTPNSTVSHQGESCYTPNTKTTNQVVSMSPTAHVKLIEKTSNDKSSSSEQHQGGPLRHPWWRVQTQSRRGAPDWSNLVEELAQELEAVRS
ncbi:hypothetical protein Pmani_030789 [Petrolisthes manimaculis]|uniref:Uncharacterized protein n=1 Tax=Petrolisthes manimaculis TaxID=1843537 RepID=A0AAE1NX77_9EUCA|nr:hypothetical protein Pmani_030789 [Petrolisthes manimaculis]